MKVTIYNREGSKKWWLRYVDREGIIRRTSSGSTDKAVARQMADKIEAELAQWTPPTGDGGQSPGGADVDPLARQIAELEHLMLTVVSYQAQAQIGREHV